MTSCRIKNLRIAPVVLAGWLWLAGIGMVLAQQPLDTLKFPAAVKITRDGREPVQHGTPVFAFEDLSEGSEHAVFPGPPCLDGSYYVGFQLYYDLTGHSNTAIRWSDYLEVSLLHGEDTLWRQPLRLDMQSQTVLATIFHDQAITCDGDYRFFINRHDSTGVVPVDYIDLRVLLYKQDQDVFNPALAIDLDYCQSSSADQVTVAWSYAGAAWLEYDLEWVFIEEHESIDAMTPQQAFQFKQPARITTAASHWDHLAYYPNGRIWYRVRAVGYNPQYPGHRIPGAWSYSACGAHTIENHQQDKSWQKQVVFAEEGKSKTIMQYFDGTLRQRQSLTNLNQEKVTVVAESLYDFEGRRSSDIMTVPTLDASLKYHEAFNTFQTQDPVVDANTGTGRSKFHYDNYRLTNSILSNISGAANYYSPQSQDSTIHQAFVPDAEGYVYSQTEYLRDGTGRVSRQSGVGKEFRMDGQHITRYYYAEPNREELIRLFGTNVGDASHYKKNLVVDPNGQVSVSYQDQEDRVIATALAGDAPLNVEHLPSYDSLSTDSITVSILDRNTFQGTVSETITKITNVSPSRYTFRYNLSALGATVEGLGCQTCKYDLDLVLTDPEGMKVDLSAFPGNQTPTTKRDGTYRRIGITAASCNDSTEASEVVLSIWMSEIGSYTLSKTLKAHELTYEEMAIQVRQDVTFQQQVVALQQHFGVDSANCELCTSACPGMDELIDDTIEDVSHLDCDNILQQILSDIRAAHASDDEIYTPMQADLDAHPSYCKYLLCSQNVESDIFDRRLARHTSWENARAEYPSVLDSDPFFNDPALSGATKKGDMTSALADILLGTVPYDYTGDGVADISNVYRGPIESIVDPANTAFYVDDNGRPNSSSGRHILYLDVMSRRNKLGEGAYAKELSQQRWMMYRAFYTEAKRKIKLNVYQGCSAALEELQASDELMQLDTDAEVQSWAEEHGAIGHAPVSDAEIETAINSIRNACGTEINPSDRQTITGYLRTYFNENKKNYLRLILPADVGNNPSLNAIQEVLNGYNCDLVRAAIENPVICIADTIVSIAKGLRDVQQLGRTLLPQGNEEFVQVAESEADVALNKQFELEKEKYNSVRQVAALEAAIQKPATSTPRQGGTAKVTALAENCVCPSQLEYEALIALYNATNGSAWTDTTGWAGGAAHPTEVRSVAGWKGVYVNSQGHVTDITLSSNNLNGTLPKQLRNLTSLQTLYLNGNKLQGTIPVSLNPNILYVNLANNDLHGTLPDSLQYFSSLRDLRLAYNELSGGIPSFFGNMASLQSLDFYNCGLSGTIPDMFTNLINLDELNFGKNQLSGTLPASIGALQNLRLLDLTYNQLSGNIPASFGGLREISWLLLDHNQLTGSIPAELDNMGTSTCQMSRIHLIPNIWLGLSYNKLSGVIPPLSNLTAIPDVSACGTGSQVRLDFRHNGFATEIPSFHTSSNVIVLHVLTGGNRLTFSTQLKSIKESTSQIVSYEYSPQDSVDFRKQFTVQPDRLYILTASVDLSTAPLSKFQWFRYVDGVHDIPLQAQPATNNYRYVINNTVALSKNVYYYKIINDDASGLVLTSRLQTVNVMPDPNRVYYGICLAYDTTNTSYQKFVFEIDWNKRFLDCIKNAHSEDSLLLSYATNKLLETYVGRFSKSYTTACFKNTLENLAYTYTPREYHYTLYYYDQAANLVQTVPPAGVHPLGHDQVLDFLNDNVHHAPPHTLVTRYRYNSLNQLIWQSTPDAGESNFWYNGLGQLRLSQNAQQYKDTLYSYSRYDEQGRIVEVGEMATADSLHTLVARVDSLLFPQAQSYTLTDITRTHYDFTRPGLPDDFEQQHLRTRVSWVEVLEKYQTDTISTTYSYDVHGNVKSLLQDIPGLSPKRTDYVYDLVSGKVNYVLYQFAQSDQFIHRYGYDDDNRITDVHTSSDGFIWDHDARYYYYKHGPLARTELGEYRVQGLDYYYTLQGWIKGVNIPYQDDPAVGNVLDEGVGKDVFSYALGYYQGDYKPVAPGLVPPDTRDNLWTRQQEMHGHTGLYNGNISWMITDLAKLGEVAGNRAKGMQAMLYKYDQLHRLVKSRSLTQYDPTGGFAARSQSPGAYDENYTYDPNGNIQTLLRHNETGGVMDDFNYGYYANSNKLREVKPVTKIKEYTSGPIRTDNIVYRNVKIHGTAHVPAGSTVEVKALDDILMDPDFQAHEESDFWAHIVEDEGTYQYDANGNLILDQDEGVKIRWTPQGKVRDVSLRGDSIILSFRYDALGNRVIKKIVRKDSIAYTTLTGYVRDATGKEIGVYELDGFTEFPMYGVGRIGHCIQGREMGSRSLGMKKFEMINQLGNVLAVVSDKMNVINDGLGGSLLSVHDYYPFGLVMKKRLYSDSLYVHRYGFNGMEKDVEIGEDQSVYTAEFWQYDARLGRRWNLDPIIGSDGSRYSVLGNSPVNLTDPKGDCPRCKDGKYTAQKGDTKESLEKQWNMKQGTLDSYNAGTNLSSLNEGQIINVSPVSVKLEEGIMLHSGTTAPYNVSFDQGFVFDPNAQASFGDYMSWVKWESMLSGLRVHGMFPDGSRATEGANAYSHFRSGEGSDYVFSLQTYFMTDYSGVIMDNSIRRVLAGQATNLLPYEGVRNFHSSPIIAGFESQLFPYPETENWQKAVGGFTFWVTGSITAVKVKNGLSYTVDYTIHARDRYDFNPGQRDMGSGAEDNDNGRFVELGWGHPFNQSSTYSSTVWKH